MTPKADRYSVQTEDSLPEPALPGADKIFVGRAPMIPDRKSGVSDLKNGNLTVGAFTLTGTGLQVSGKATQDDWTKVGELLFRLEGAIQWIIGDWLVYGEDVKWGDIPTIAEYIGRDVKTLYNYCAYSRGVKSSLRREDLSYTHHMLISGMKDEAQARALAHAAENKLSVAAFRKWIKEQQGEAEPPALPARDQFPRKFVWKQADKFFDRDPSQAKPAEVEEAQTIGRELLRTAHEYARKWGIEE